MRILFIMALSVGMINLILFTVSNYITQNNLLFGACIIALTFSFLTMIWALYQLTKY